MKRFSLLLLLVLFSCTKDPVMYDITITATDGGTVSPQSGSYEERSSVTITATPSAEYEFTGWSNGSTVNPLVLTVTSDLTIQASFTKKQYELTISKEGEGAVSERVINTGKGYDSGTKVELTAVPAVGWEFVGWTGAISGAVNPQQILINEPKVVNAIFKRLNPIYVDENGDTTKAYDWATIGQKGLINNVEYTIVNEATLRQMVVNDEDVTKVVTTRVTNMNRLFIDKISLLSNDAKFS